MLSRRRLLNLSGSISIFALLFLAWIVLRPASEYVIKQEKLRTMFNLLVHNYLITNNARRIDQVGEWWIWQGSCRKGSDHGETEKGPARVAS